MYYVNKSVLFEILDRSAARLSAVTIASYKRVVRAWLAFAGEDPNGWTRIQAQAFYDAMLARGLSAESANTEFAALQHVAKWYASQHERPDFSKIQTAPNKQRALDGEDGPIKFALTPEQVQALLATCAPPAPSIIDARDLTLFVIGLETGMRRMSLAGMRFEAITTHQRGYPIASVPVKGRGGERTFPVPLSALAMFAIERWQEWHHAKRGAVFPSFRRKLDARGQLTYTPIGALSIQSIYKITTTRAEAVGLEIHPHLLRHTFVTWRQHSGWNAVQIASFTGHALNGEYTNISPYIDLGLIAQDILNATPAWLTTTVKALYAQITGRKSEEE